MTNAIAPIFDNGNGEVRISGRQLHMFLEVQTPYAKWFDRMTEYGFTEGTDFNLDKNVQVQNEGERVLRKKQNAAAAKKARVKAEATRTAPLTLDDKAKAAKAAGMSYGKYSALMRGLLRV